MSDFILGINKLDFRGENIVSLRIGKEKESEYIFLKHYVSYRIENTLLSKFLFWKKYEEKKIKRDIYDVITRYESDKIAGITNYNEEMIYCSYTEDLFNGKNIILHNGSSDERVKLGKDKVYITGWDGHVYEGWKLIYVPFVKFESKDINGIRFYYKYYFNTNEDLKDFIDYLVRCGALSTTSAYIDERTGKIISDTRIENYIEENI